MSETKTARPPDDIETQRSRTRVAFVGDEGRYWLKKLEKDLAKLPAGTAVVTNIVNGEFVTASTRLAAMDLFDQKFGTNTTFGFVHELGRPILVGGGMAWQCHASSVRPPQGTLSPSTLHS